MPPQNPEQARWFAEHVSPHEGGLRAYLCERFPSLRDLDDVVQEAYSRLLRAHAAGKVTHPQAYLFATARNAALDLCRRNQIVSFTELDESAHSFVLDETPDAAETLSHEQELAILAEAIAALPERCRTILTLRRLHGLSYKEIGERLGIADHTINSHLGNAILRCRAFLAARGVVRGRVAELVEKAHVR